MEVDSVSVPLLLQNDHVETDRFIDSCGWDFRRLFYKNETHLRCYREPTKYNRKWLYGNGISVIPTVNYFDIIEAGAYLRTMYVNCPAKG